MNKKISDIFSWVMNVFQKYNQFQAITSYHPLRVLSITDSEAGVKVVFQVIGKAIFIESKLDEILSNDDFTSQFSSTDIRKLSLHEKEKNSINSDKSISILGKCYDGLLNKIQVNFQDSDGKQFTKMASEVISDNGIIQLLSSSDAISIGYLAGYEHSQEKNSNH